VSKPSVAPDPVGVTLHVASKQRPDALMDLLSNKKRVRSFDLGGRQVRSKETRNFHRVEDTGFGWLKVSIDLEPQSLPGGSH
jgi:hypothetical protein